MHHSAALQHWLVVLLAASALLCASGEAAGDAASAGATAAAPSQCRTSSTPVRVLALGDSLTNGAVPSQSRNYPYTQKLSQLMSAELGRPIDVKIVGGLGPANAPATRLLAAPITAAWRGAFGGGVTRRTSIAYAVHPRPPKRPRAARPGFRSLQRRRHGDAVD